MTGTGIMAGINTSLSPIEKIGDSLYPYPSQCGNFPSKRWQIRTIPTVTGLCAISNYNHHYTQYMETIIFQKYLIYNYNKYSFQLFIYLNINYF